MRKTMLFLCLSCDNEMTYGQAMKGDLFCSKLCQYTAETIRYARRSIKNGNYDADPLVREAIDIRIGAFISNKSRYPYEERKLSPAQREAIFTRDNYTCQIDGPSCTGKATEIDHINGSSSNPSNLRAVCRPCNMGRFERVPASPEQSRIIGAMWERINSPEPMRECDDDVVWPNVWRAKKSERKRMYWASIPSE
jgi:hypothetical protein